MTLLRFEAGFRLSEVGGISLNVVETGGNTFTATVADADFFLTENGFAAAGDFADIVTPYTPFLTAVRNALNAGGDPAGDYTLALSDTTRRVSIVHDGGGGVTAVSITPTAGAGLLGLTGPVSGSLSLQGQRAPDYVIWSDVGFWSEWSGEYEGGDDVAFDVEAHDGRPGGVAKDHAPTYLDLVVPTEPVAKVGNYPRLVSGTEPWTWRSLYRHCRNVQPLAMRDADEVYYLMLRADGAAFRPRSLGGNYLGHWDIPLRTRVLGTGA